MGELPCLGQHRAGERREGGAGHGTSCEVRPVGSQQPSFLPHCPTSATAPRASIK